MPVSEAVEFRRQEHFVIRDILDAEHDWRSPGGGEGVQDAQERDKGKQDQHLQRGALHKSQSRGKNGEQSRAYPQEWVDEKTISQIVATCKGGIRHNTDASTRR